MEKVPTRAFSRLKVSFSVKIVSRHEIDAVIIRDGWH